MSKANTPQILWVDLETTGSEIDGNSLIEIGAVVTDSTRWLNELGSFEVVISTEPDEWLDVVPVVMDMHMKNGLMVDSVTGGVAYGTALMSFKSWVESFEFKGRIPLGGSGVAHFDRGWIDAHFVDEYELPPLQYWSYDIGSMRRFARLAGLRDLSDFGYDGVKAGPGKTHRALDDIRDHISEARALMLAVSS